MDRHRKLFITISGVLIMLCTGILYMWSVFQPHVTAHHGWNPGTTSLTSSVMIACFALGNITSGLLQTRIHPRFVALAGSVLFALGFYLTPLVNSDTPFMLYLTYGIVGGFGCGLVYCAALAALQKWYAAKMGFITGIAVGFFGLSVVILAPLVESLLNRVGLTGTFRILSLVFFVIPTVSSLFLKNPDKAYYYAEVTKAIKAENVRQFRPREMLKSPSYYYIILSTFTSSAAYMVIVPFISSIAISRGMSTSLALAAVMCTGVGNSLGRIFAPMISDKIGRTSTLITCSLISVLGCLLIIPAKGVVYIAAVFIISLAYGGNGGTNPVITTELFGARYSGVNYGFVLASMALASIFFGRVSASLSSGGDFTLVFIICAPVCIIPIIAMLRLRRRCKKLGKII